MGIVNPPLRTPYDSSATFTPAAASHTAGDSVGVATEFKLFGPPGGRVMVTSATLEIDDATVVASAFRVYLFSITPPSALADDAAFVLASGDRASFLGYVDLGTAIDLGSTQWVETHGINKQMKPLTTSSVWGYLINLTTVTPAAVAHIVTLHTMAL